MTTRISLLPENLCNQIAAGEVVERPASVVKELIENSLDAGAAQICIEVEGGGRTLVRVTDDGDGMGKDDVFLCLERHATSKISSAADLFRLKTLGFRGEALPSIAAVSRLTVRSRTELALEGWEIYVEGGAVRRAGATGLPKGTTVEVRDLFFNTPARRKFLRRDETEFGHIAELVTRLALAAPEVQFRLIHNQRTLINAPRQKSLEERIAVLLGRPLLADLARVERHDPSGTLSLRGLISHPELSRASSAAIYTYINGRYIRDRVVQHAILEGIRHLFPRGRYPVAILFLAIPAGEVDVNVHPTKHEVRFCNQSAIHHFIAAAVQDALRDGVAAPFAVSHDEPSRTDATESVEPAIPSEPAVSFAATAVRSEEGPQPSFVINDTARAQWVTPFPVQTVLRPAPVQSALPVAETPDRLSFFSSLRVIGQFRESYIVAEDGDGLILIDQHAAHERIGFERLRREYRQGEVVRQGLLFPQVVEFAFRESALLTEQLDTLLRLGFELEAFGTRTFVLKAVPQLLSERGDHVRLLHDLASDLAELGVSKRIEDAVDSLLLLIACHGMVRAHQALSPAEIAALLADLDRIDFNACCPHGRPVHARLTTTEIARLFRRSA